MQMAKVRQTHRFRSGIFLAASALSVSENYKPLQNAFRTTLEATSAVGKMGGA